jgi:hypothetical protein
MNASGSERGSREAFTPEYNRDSLKRGRKARSYMSWSVHATGTPAEVRGKLNEQFKGPLAEKPAGLADDGERETVQNAQDFIEQVLGTYAPDKAVSVDANGSMGFNDWLKKTGPYQNVYLKIAS